MVKEKEEGTLTTELQEHICDNLCRHPRETKSQKALEAICKKCKISKLEINDSRKAENIMKLEYGWSVGDCPKCGNGVISQYAWCPKCGQKISFDE